MVLQEILMAQSRFVLRSTEQYTTVGELKRFYRFIDDFEPGYVAPLFRIGVGANFFAACREGNFIAWLKKISVCWFVGRSVAFGEVLLFPRDLHNTQVNSYCRLKWMLEIICLPLRCRSATSGHVVLPVRSMQSTRGQSTSLAQACPSTHP